MSGLYEFQREDAERFAREQGIGTKVRGDELQLRYCPYCRNKTNDKETFAINLRTGQFKCLRATCAAHGNMLTLAKDFNFSLGRDVDEYYRRLRRYKDLRRFPVPETKPEAVEYLEGRGISRQIAEEYHIGVRKDDSMVLVFPFYDENRDLQFIKFRNAKPAEGQPKEWSQPECKPILFGMDHCDPDRAGGSLVLTEGQIDSLSVAEAYGGNINAVSVPTGALGFTWVPYCWDFLGKFNTLVVFGDHENGHITLLDEMARRFHGIVKHVRPEDYKDCKDANELLQRYGKQAVIDAVENAVPVVDPHIEKVADIQRQQLSSLERFSTGIAQLDRIMGGFYMGNVILLTGERGLGKSTLASQFGAYAIKAGYPTMFYSGELPDFFFRDWFDRQVAGANNINRLVASDGFESFTVNESVMPKIAAWYDDKAYMFSEGGSESEDEGEMLLKTIKKAVQQYQCRVFIIDNLMTAMTDDLRADLYRQQSIFVKKLTDMARNLSIFILLVVHPRKQVSGSFGNDDVMGSGNITNLAHAVIRYTSPKEDDERRPDRVLQVTKNRINGKTDFVGIALYYQDSSKRISESRLFDWSFGWEDAPEPIWEPEDDDDIPF